MKLSLFLAILSGLIVSLHSAEPFVTPDFVRELKDLEPVKSQAARENKCVTFLLMEPGST